MANYDSYYPDKSKSKLFFDIETIPADEKNKEITIEIGTNKIKSRKFNRFSSKLTKDDIYRQSALSGDFGRVFCIGYAINDQKVQIINGEENEILETWWRVANNADLFIGHNIIDFDLRFIYKRSIINKIKPSAKHLNLSFARYKNFPIYDTMREWEKWNPESFISLDTLAKIFGFESSKKTIKGSNVYDYYLKNKYQEIYTYCQEDVKLTRKIYKRMCFED